MMKFLHAIIRASLASLALYFSASAQDIRWATGPEKGFVFQITNNEAQRLLAVSSTETIHNGLLHTLIDTFNIEEGWINRPQKGHFILASIVENKLHCQYTGVFPYQVFLPKEYDALALQVLDLDGNVRTDAKVKFRIKRLHLDPDSKTYRIENERVQEGSSFVTVELDGYRSVFNIEKHEVPTWYHDYSNEDGPAFYSYLITDKNKYRPGEKVRFKSYALSGGRAPLRKDLNVWIINGTKSIKVAHVTPHRPVSFTGEFQLHDSLNLVLDRPYTLQLVDEKGRLVSTCNFKYEDYTLNGNKLDLRLTNIKQFHPQKNAIAITATDANGLILKDARAAVVVKTQTIRETFQPLVTLPDTLLFREIDLDPDSATVVEIPSGLFQRSNTAYLVHVTVLNTENQRIEGALSATHFYSSFELNASFVRDSIVYELTANGVPVRDVPVQLFHDDEGTAKRVTLPYAEKINPVVSRVRITGDIVSREIPMSSLTPRLRINGGIQRDSFNISLDNPQRLDVSWYIYQGSTLLQKGSGTDLEYRTIIGDRTRTLYVELLYTFAGNEHINRREYTFSDGKLNVSLDMPERVYPGQNVPVEITVTDQLGDPVSGVDLTALAVTTKLDYYLPDLPHYGNTSTPRPRRAHYSKNEINKRSAILDLDYNRWEKPARLDTMMYYRFTYPREQTFRHTVEIFDSTQFAPYVMQHGEAKTIYVIEVDRRPVYYSWVDQPVNYSFYVSSDRPHEISLRLFDKVLVLDYVWFDACKKTILSIDLDHLPAGIDVHPIYVPQKKQVRGKTNRPAFTETEIWRHLQYLSSFSKVEGNAYLESATQFIPLFRAHARMGKAHVIAGPVIPGKVTFYNDNVMKTTYRHTGGYRYTFEDNIVYKQDVEKLIPDVLYDGSARPLTTVNDLAQTKEKFLRENIPAVKWHARVLDLVDPTLRMTVLLPEEKAASGIGIFLFENCRTKRVISPCQNIQHGKPDYFTIPRGLHNAILVYNNGTYIRMDSIELKSYHKTVADLNQATLHSPDTLSRRWLETPGYNCYPAVPEYSKRIMLNYSGNVFGNVKGSIYDEMNMPLIGATVLIKGTDIGTSVDTEGRFSLDINDRRAILVISFIGYMTQEIEVGIGSDISLSMTPDVQQLSEVVVVGYGVSRQMSITAALSGRVAGVNIAVAEERIDGEEEVEDGEENLSEAGQKLYRELMTLDRIRSNFSDVGFWEPRLYTNKQGRSTFTVVIPDDITMWEATVYAMNRRLQTGTARKSIKSYKPIMAELHVPRFLTRGDSAFVIGKVLNYSQDAKIAGMVKWSGARTDFEKSVILNSYHTDQLPVQPATTDSVTTRYEFIRDDGYRDGEERTIPVIEQGTIRANGSLSVLANGEEIHVKAGDKEKVKIEILNTQLDIYAGEVRSLIDYKYACNEQLASKLIGLLNYRTLMAYEGKPFRYDIDVNKIIARLLKNQNQEFLWSWWDVSPNTSYWMSGHILRALRSASDAGYTVRLEIENITRKAVYKFDIVNELTLNDVDLVHALASWNAGINYGKYLPALDSLIRSIEYDERKATARKYMNGKWYLHSRLREKLLVMETRQMLGLPYQRDSLLRYRKESIMGGIHFSDDRPAISWYCDDLAVNTIAYRIVKRDSTLHNLRIPMQMYFLSERKKGYWNTYHSSNILMSVLPDLISSGASKAQIATVGVRGSVHDKVTGFPYTLHLQPGEEVYIQKESGLPMYMMQFVEERVTRAKTGVDGFEIRTFLAGEQGVLESGKPVTLTVEVKVKKDASAEYVMIEVPVPATCNYADKRQAYSTVETHREYFRDRTVIFCQQMTEGTYRFYIQLIPQFQGMYQMNPAQVSLMYVPVVNANNDMKKVMVK